VLQISLTETVDIGKNTKNRKNKIMRKKGKIENH